MEDFERASDQGDLAFVISSTDNEDHDFDRVADIGSDDDDRIPLLQALKAKSTMGKADLE